MALSGKHRRYLRGLAHHLNPVVLTGTAGVTEAVIEKVNTELENHELIKVRIGDGPLTAKDAVPMLEAGTGGVSCQVIGKIVVLYRRRKEGPEIKLPRS